jgi:hypothetical protein
VQYNTLSKILHTIVNWYISAKSKINGAKIIKQTARLPSLYINGCSRPNKLRPTAAYGSLPPGHI